jgi:hypothetical protein
MKIINKIKSLFKKENSELNVSAPVYVIPEPIGEIHYFDFKYEEPTMETKIMAQKIGLDLVNVKRDPNMVITSGYMDFKENVELSPEEILFQMKKVKRASEKVLEKMTETEAKHHKSLEYFKHKAEQHDK